MLHPILTLGYNGVYVGGRCRGVTFGYGKLNSLFIGGGVAKSLLHQPNRHWHRLALQLGYSVLRPQQHIYKCWRSHQQQSSWRSADWVRGFTTIKDNSLQRPHQTVCAVTNLSSMKQRLLDKFPDTLSDSLSHEWRQRIKFVNEH